MVAYYMTHHTNIAYTYISKSFFTVIINDNNCLYHNIIVHKFDTLIDIVIF